MRNNGRLVSRFRSPLELDKSNHNWYSHYTDFEKLNSTADYQELSAFRQKIIFGCGYQEML